MDSSDAILKQLELLKKPFYRIGKNKNKITRLGAPAITKAKLTLEKYSMSHFISNNTISTKKPIVTKPIVTNKKECSFFNHGYCQLGTSCKYSLDPTKRQACPRYLNGNCTKLDCALNHELNENNTPNCLFFQKASGCSLEQCRYVHEKIDLSIEICNDLVRSGYCIKGKE